MAKKKTFFETVTAAVNDISDTGFDSIGRIEKWSKELRKAAERTLTSEKQMTSMLREAMSSVYRGLLDKGEIAHYHPGVSRFEINKIKPSLRLELDRRIYASADLIKSNRQQSIAKTIQRFQGWATSVPKGGAAAGQKVKSKEGISKALRQLPFEERRVIIDQGHKLTASINNIIAVDGGALALFWHSNWRQPGYNYREDHKERDLQVYLIRDSWAHKKGLIKAGPAGFYDKITAVGEEPFCRCWAQYIYTISELPKDMLTDKGKAALAEARAKMKAAS